MPGRPSPPLKVVIALAVSAVLLSAIGFVTGRVGGQLVAEKPSLRVLGWQCDKESGYLVVQGEVQNISPTRLEHVLAVVTWRTTAGAFVTSAEAILTYTPLLPEQVSPFKVIAAPNPAATRCELGFRLFSGKQLLFER
jgi:hypothetical protein